MEELQGMPGKITLILCREETRKGRKQKKRSAAGHGGGKGRGTGRHKFSYEAIEVMHTQHSISTIHLQSENRSMPHSSVK